MVVMIEAWMVPTLSTLINGFSSELQWGVSTTMDQVCLSYPCIGVGCVHLRLSNDTVTTPHVACCLRGSATYLIPLLNDKTDALDLEDDGFLQAFAVSHEAVETFTPPRLQDFAAFNLDLQVSENQRTPPSKLSDPASSIPIAVYVWPGGVVDIFTTGLLRVAGVTPPRQTAVLLDELVSNGAAQLLCSALSSSFSCGDAGLESDWQAAREDVLKLEEGVVVQRGDLDSEHLKAFRKVLLALAEP
jgi:hypothetical protein